MVGLDEATENYSDEEVHQGNHSKLLSAVSRIYKKQRVDKPKRSEPYLDVSEYHLASSETNADSNKVEVYDLVKVLERKSSQKQIKSKFESVLNRSSKLPKPLEKVFEDKVKRSVGYEHVKNHVSRWNSLVNQNRTAPQLKFPLQDHSEIKVYRPLEFLSTFKEPTELEKNMAEVLTQSTVAQEDSKVEEAVFNLSIPEMVKKRKLMAKFKSKESFKIVKAMKQNKIKSKKYRRILRKEKIKQELKDFETLQKTDPEAALEKLNKLEKERAEERASLRHRNTGKWARGQAIRAKFDREARIQLAEQIAKSRELTRKRKISNESSSEKESDDEEEEGDEKLVISKGLDDDNPWIQENEERCEETIDEFISGYQDYWKKNKKEGRSKATINKAALARLVGKGVKGTKSTTKIHEPVVTRIVGENTSIEIVNMSNDSQHRNDKNPIQMLKGSSLNNNDVTDVEKEPVHSPESLTFSEVSKKSAKTNSNLNVLKSTEIYEDVAVDIEGSRDVHEKSDVGVNVIDSEQSFDKDTVVKSKRKSKRKTIRNSILNTSGTWEINSDESLSKSDAKNMNRSLDDMFDTMEDCLQEKVKERFKRFDDASGSDDEGTKVKRKKGKSDKKNLTVRPENKIINETTDLVDEERDEELDDLLKIIVDDSNKNGNVASGLNENNESGSSDKEAAIDPNKFLNVKPRVLNTQIPDLMIEGDDTVDDPREDRRINISEAFAEDDVVEEFKQEKENEIKSEEQRGIDLYLPGWGSWGGPNVNHVKERRKRKRFFIEAPKLKRKDSSKPNVIINEDISEKYKEHMVCDVPYPFTSVKSYEASVRAPIGSTWMPESAVSKLTRPPVIKKLGTVIEPMSEAQLLNNNKKNTQLKINNIKITDGTNIK